jgi:hypothetical protein
MQTFDYRHLKLEKYHEIINKKNILKKNTPGDYYDIIIIRLLLRNFFINLRQIFNFIGDYILELFFNLYLIYIEKDFLFDCVKTNKIQKEKSQKAVRRFLSSPCRYNVLIGKPALNFKPNLFDY